MVTVFFTRDGARLLELSVQYGQQVKAVGDASWLDYGFRPYSNHLGRPVSFNEDPEEWARSLPFAYAGAPGMDVTVTADTATTVQAPQNH